MSANEEKRMAGDYVITHALHIGDREIVLGENPSGAGDERYMCAFCQTNELLASYTEVMVSGDYAELVKLFGERVAEQAEKTRIQDFKYDILKHPHVKLTTDGGAEPYRHGEDTRSIASIQFDPQLLKQAAEPESDAVAKHDFILLTEEELEEYITNHGGTTK